MTPEEKQQLLIDLKKKKLALLVAQRSGYGKPVVEGGRFQVGGEVNTLKEHLGGAVEPAAAMLTGMAGETVGNLAAGAAELFEPTRAMIAGEPTNRRIGLQTRDYVRDAMTYKPRTDQGKRVTGNMAQFMQPVAEAVEMARLGDEALEAGLPMGVAAAAEGIPEYLGAFLASRGMPTQKVEPVKFPAGVRDVKAARFIKTSKGMEKYAPAQKAHKQGWSDEVIAVARTGAKSKGTRSKMLDMINMAKRGKSDPVWGASNRPSQVLGESVMERYSYLKGLNKQAGGMIDDVAKDFLAGKRIDHVPIINKFQKGIRELGGVYQDGKLVFPKGSRLHGQPANQKGLRVIMDQVDSMGPNPDAYRLHLLKQNIDDFVSYGKKPGSVSAMSGKTESLLKTLRKDINAKLKGASNNYDTVNTIFSDTRDAMNALGEAFGKNLYGDSAVMATGETMRRWIGRATTRGPIMNAFRKADDISAKYGGKFDDAAEPQILMSNILDDFLTDPGMRATAKADIGSRVQQVIERSTLHNVATGADDIINRMRGIDDMSALKSLEELVRAGQ